SAVPNRDRPWWYPNRSFRAGSVIATCIEIEDDDDGSTAVSSVTGKAVHDCESAPAVPPATPLTTIAWAWQPRTPLDHRRIQIVSSGVASALVNEMVSAPAHECPCGPATRFTLYAGAAGLRTTTP